MSSANSTIAVVLPCYNEAACIGLVIQQFQEALPEATVHVFDNASTDDTAAVAKAHGAQVHHVALKGKGNVVRRMFADVEADIYVMTDGDATYDVSNIREMIDGVRLQGCDMVVGVRVDDGANVKTYRPGHRLGNQLLTGTAGAIFGGTFTDMLSGHRIFSRRYAKSFPAMSHGFETETELTVHALGLRMPYMEFPVAYRSRPEGSVSKLSTYRDGWRILRTILGLFTSERPMSFYSLLAAVLALGSVALAEPLVTTYLETGQVPRFPTAILSTGMMISAFLSLVCGVLLRNVTLARQEAKRLVYLAIPSARKA
ncbi:glycosyltransferase family 2 protein [Xylophilus sp. GW821-FHT01B05]